MTTIRDQYYKSWDIVHLNGLRCTIKTRFGKNDFSTYTNILNIRDAKIESQGSERGAGTRAVTTKFYW